NSALGESPWTRPVTGRVAPHACRSPEARLALKPSCNSPCWQDYNTATVFHAVNLGPVRGLLQEEAMYAGLCESREIHSGWHHDDEGPRCRTVRDHQAQRRGTRRETHKRLLLLGRIRRRGDLGVSEQQGGHESRGE